MSGTDPIDAAFKRAQCLRAILKWVRDQATANPSQGRWVALGLMSAYETKQRAVAELESSFDQLFGLIEHLAIIDMASSFERASRRRLSTRVGEARTAPDTSAKRGRSVPQLAGLLRDVDDYDNLKSIENFISSYTDRRLMDEFSLVRSARNNFAHGTDIVSAPAIEADRACENLKAVLKLI